MTTEHTPFPHEGPWYVTPAQGNHPTLITDRPPVRRPIHDGPGDPAAKTLTLTLFLTGIIGVLFGAAGQYDITYACLTIAITAVAAAAAYRRAVNR